MAFSPGTSESAAMSLKIGEDDVRVREGEAVMTAVNVSVRGEGEGGRRRAPGCKFQAALLVAECV